MPPSNLKKLLKSPESPTLDFKEEAYWADTGLLEAKKYEFLTDILAMANSPTGETGRILMGVKEQPDGIGKPIASIPRVDDAKLLRPFVEENVDQHIDWTLHYEKVQGHTLALIEVKPVLRFPVCANKKIPRGDGLYPHEIRVRNGTKNTRETPANYIDRTRERILREAPARHFIIPPIEAPPRDSTSQETLDLIGRIHETLRAHELLPTHLPRLYPKLGYSILNSPAEFAKAINSEWADDFCEKFWLNRAWFDGTGGPKIRTLRLGFSEGSILHQMTEHRKADLAPALYFFMDRPGMPDPKIPCHCAVVLESRLEWEYEQSQRYQPLYKILDLRPGEIFGPQVLFFLLRACRELDIESYGCVLPDLTALSDIASGGNFIGPALDRLNKQWAVSEWLGEHLLSRSKEWGLDASIVARTAGDIQKAKQSLKAKA